MSYGIVTEHIPTIFFQGNEDIGAVSLQAINVDVEEILSDLDVISLYIWRWRDFVDSKGRR